MTASGRAALLILLAASPALAQTVVDGSDAAVGPEAARAAIALIGRGLPEGARVSGLRPGRAGALCGQIDVTNRMGRHTGPRGFVADLGAGFAGRLPEGPELRNPGGVAEYRAMQRALDLFRANCAEE